MKKLFNFIYKFFKKKPKKSPPTKIDVTVYQEILRAKMNNRNYH